MHRCRSHTDRIRVTHLVFRSGPVKQLPLLGELTPHPPVPANDAHLPPLPPPLLLLFPPPLAPPLTPLGMMIGAPKVTTSFSASNATNDFDPVGATSPAKCSAPNLRSALVGLNFLNYNDLPHDDVRLRLSLSPTHLTCGKSPSPTADRRFSLLLPRCLLFLVLFFFLLLFSTLLLASTRYPLLLCALLCHISLSAQIPVSPFFRSNF